MNSQNDMAEMARTQDTEASETQKQQVKELVQTLETYAANIRTGFRDSYSLFNLYDYVPLSNRNSIRLVTVWGSGNTSDPLICEIREHSLDSQPLYSALSYTWGGQKSDREMIVVDSLVGHNNLVAVSKVLLTQTCEEALKEMRGRLAIDTFDIWVDSICINQQDIPEREAQVSMMDKIYSQATQVNIWLGPGTPSSDRFFQVLEALLPLWEERKKVTGQYFMCEDPPTKALIAAIPNFEFTSEDLVSRDYWSRTWCFQEVVLAQRHMVYCGSYRHVFPDLFGHFGIDRFTVQSPASGSFSLFLLKFCHYYASGRPKDSRPEGVDAIHTWKSPILRSPLLDAMMLQSTDPRDKVYGFRSVFPDILGQIPVDYKVDLAVLYTEAATRTIKFYNHVEPLSLVVPSRHNPDFRLPSWVPDLSCISPFSQTTVAERHGWNCTKQSDVTVLPENKNQGTSTKHLGLHLPSWIRKTRSWLGLRKAMSDPSSEVLDHSTQKMFCFSENGKVLRVKGKKIGQIAGYTGAISDDLVIKAGLRHSKYFSDLCYSRRMLECIRTLREEVPSTQDHILQSQRFVEHLVAWELSVSSDDGFAKALKDMNVPLKVILAGISESAISIDELNLAVAPLIQKVDGKYRWQHESFWTDRGHEFPDPDDLVQPGSVESHILIWLAKYQIEFLALLIMDFVPFYAGKRIFVTEAGQVGYGDAAIEKDDGVYLIAGGDTPFVIREGKETNRLMGWAYLDGVMMGECWPDDYRLLETIELS